MNTNIIPQTAAAVNVSVRKATKLPDKWTIKKMQAKQVASRLVKLDKTGYYRKRGERMANCSEVIQYEYCHDCGYVHILQARLCRDRVCPICNWRQALLQYSQMIQTLDAFYNMHTDSTAYFLTLTVPSCTPATIDRTMQNMSIRWDKLMHRAWVRKHVAGWARKTEITYNAVTGLLHPHFHIIVMANDTPDILIDYWLQYNTGASAAAQDLQTIATATTTDRQTMVPVDLTEPDNSIVGAILETFKYTTKSSDILQMPLGVLRQYLSGIDGKRLIAYGGIIRDIRADLKLQEDVQEEEESTGLCIKCSSPQLERAAAAWSFATATYDIINTVQVPMQTDALRTVTID